MDPIARSKPDELKMLVSSWWMFAIRGVLAVAFGILALLQPLTALLAFVVLVGAWSFVDGISALALAMSGWRSGLLVLCGVAGIAVGLITFFRPGITVVALYAVVAGWSLARGVLEIALAIKLRRKIQGEVWMILGGVASILFGAMMIALPAVGVLTLGYLIGVYALLFGFIWLALAFRLRRVREERTTHRPLPSEPQWSAT